MEKAPFRLAFFIYWESYTLLFQNPPFASAHLEHDTFLLPQISFCFLMDVCKVIDFKSFYYFNIQMQLALQLSRFEKNTGTKTEDLFKEILEEICISANPFSCVIPLTCFLLWILTCTSNEQRCRLLHIGFKTKFCNLNVRKQEASEHENSSKACGQRQMDDQNIINQ